MAQWGLATTRVEEFWAPKHGHKIEICLMGLIEQATDSANRDPN
jgi:hypothetical protein